MLLALAFMLLVSSPTYLALDNEVSSYFADNLDDRAHADGDGEQILALTSQGHCPTVESCRIDIGSIALLPQLATAPPSRAPPRV